MKVTLKDILQLDQPKYRPSIEFAKAFLEDRLFTEERGALGVPTILDRYFDQSYTPSLEDINDWIGERSGALTAELGRLADEFTSEMSNESSPLWKALQSSLNRNLSGEIDRDALVLEIAEHFAWMDSSPLWGGTAADSHWHTANMQSASLRLSEANIEAIDALADLQQEHLSQLIECAEGILSGTMDAFSLENLHASAASWRFKAEIVRVSQEKMTSYGIKLGFLFRDAWWIERHGGVTIRGYLAQQTFEKAGVGGGKHSSGKRVQRIRYFLRAHAELIGRNPILREDPPDEVAFRALKLAIKKHPAAFKEGRSKRAAVEYWGYLKSDELLWGEYENALKTINYADIA
jgi:hypothetical protein